MLKFFNDKHERQLFIKIVLITLLSFLMIASINFGLIAKDLAPKNIILPFIIGLVVGILLAYNKLLQNRLQRSNNTKTQFMARMNHELGTPMNAIIGFAGILKDDTSLSKEQQEDVENILYAGNHTIQLINELLDFSRIESGKVSLSPMEIFPVNTMQQSIDMVKTLAEKNAITIEHKLPQNVDMILMADEVRLTQIFVNILSNAIKYNRVHGQVVIDYTCHKDNLDIILTDTGMGIDKAQMPYLYEPFNRLGAEKTAIEGTGVGLSITQSLVEMMNGRINCESEPQVGTRITLSFPLMTLTA